MHVLINCSWAAGCVGRWQS